MGCVIETQATTSSSGDITCRFVGRDSEEGEHKLQIQSRTVVEYLTDTKSKNAHELASVGALTQTDVEKMI